MAQREFEEGEDGLVQDEPGRPGSAHDREGYRYGWEAGQRGEYAVHTWNEVEPLLRAGWETRHREAESAVAHRWAAVVADVRRGWDAARRELEASL